MPVAQGARWIGGPNQTAGWNVEIVGDGTSKLNFGDISSTSTRTTITNATTLIAGWNHIAYTRSGTTMTYYVNGVAATGIAGTLDIAVNNAAGEYYRELSIGDNTNASLASGAGVDDLALWRGTSISASDISDIYNSGTGASIASLVPEPSSSILASLSGLALILRCRK